MTDFAAELARVVEQGAAAVLATVVEAAGDSGVEAGEKWLVRGGRIALGGTRNEALRKRVIEEAALRLREEKSKLVAFDLPESGAKFKIFFDVIPEPPKLYVVGAGHIAVPLVKIAKILDFHVTVIDDRLQYANRERFAEADQVLVGDMGEALAGLAITPSTYIVLITRGHKYDEPCLRVIIHSKAKYIGMIGSKRRVRACFERFKKDERIAEEVIERVYAPIGLDLNAETPEEIALAILAEIVKVRRGGKAQSLSRH
jgi:xanthine dehydrogenase accessory factor